ncbi:TlpA disulfide reductase family protein [Lysobacter korlensis]|uniref:TlpA disulfide reductase family protein n=1 Tax=Lysobacter korlensis TaxID=553636 RepID=A0ABV6RSQ6_9GAMM
MTPRRRTLTLGAGVLALASVLLAGCSSSEDPLAGFGSGSNQNYISGDGTELELAPAERGEPIGFEGETPDGKTISSAELEGEVFVVNFWYAGCPPCRAEAADLEATYQEFADDGVQFVGVNTYDDGPTAEAFERTYGITYPSILDAQRNRVQLAFAGDVPPNAVPTTLVMDREGRVAARISGRIGAPSILESMIQRVLDESGASTADEDT